MYFSKENRQGRMCFRCSSTLSVVFREMSRLKSRCGYDRVLRRLGASRTESSRAHHKTSILSEASADSRHRKLPSILSYAFFSPPATRGTKGMCRTRRALSHRARVCESCLLLPHFVFLHVWFDTSLTFRGLLAARRMPRMGRSATCDVWIRRMPRTK